jgi:hypothetical protein
MEVKQRDKRSSSALVGVPSEQILDTTFRCTATLNSSGPKVTITTDRSSRRSLSQTKQKHGPSIKPISNKESVSRTLFARKMARDEKNVVII